MKKVVLATALMIGTLFAGKAPVSNMPISKQASIVENYSASELKLKATGMGRKDRDAIQDVKKAAVHFVLFSGTDPILRTPAEKAKFEEGQEAFFANANILNYISWEASKVVSASQTRLPNGKKGYAITKHVRVDTKKIKDYLVGQGIVTSKDELAEAIGLPFIMVLPEVPKGQTPLQVFDGNPLAKQAAGVIESYLTAKKYDVVVPRAQEQLNSLASVQSSLKGATEDVSYQLALSLGADIYIVFSGQVQNSKATVVVKAYETTTARLLGTETGYSANRPGASQQALVEEAINGAIGNVMSRLNTYWMDDVKRGSQYKLVIKMLDEFDEDEAEEIQFEIMDAMEMMFSTTKENIVTDKSMDYLVWATKDDYKKSSSIYRTLKKELKEVAKIKKISLNKKFIVLGVQEADF